MEQTTLYMERTHTRVHTYTHTHPRTKLIYCSLLGIYEGDKHTLCFHYYREKEWGIHSFPLYKKEQRMSGGGVYSLSL